MLAALSAVCQLQWTLAEGQYVARFNPVACLVYMVAPRVTGVRNMDDECAAPPTAMATMNGHWIL